MVRAAARHHSGWASNSPVSCAVAQGVTPSARRPDTATGGVTQGEVDAFDESGVERAGEPQRLEPVGETCEVAPAHAAFDPSFHSALASLLTSCGPDVLRCSLGGPPGLGRRANLAQVNHGLAADGLLQPAQCMQPVNLTGCFIFGRRLLCTAQTVTETARFVLRSRSAELRPKPACLLFVTFGIQSSRPSYS